MADSMLKCPNCGVKLKNINGVMTCKECGYYVREKGSDKSPYNSWLDYENPGEEPDQKPRTDVWQARGESSTAERVQGDQSAPVGKRYQPAPGSKSYQPVPKNSGYQSPSGAHALRPLLVVFVSVLVVLIATFIITISAIAPRTPDYPYDSWENAGEYPPDIREDQGEMMVLEGSPQSAFFRQLCEQIYGKACEEITPEEFAGLTAFSIDTWEKTCSYELEDRETGNFDDYGDLEIDFADLRIFTGLKRLYMPQDFLWNGYLDGLEELCEVYTANTLAELAAAIPHPEQITALGAEDYEDKKNLEDLKAFPNLRRLSLNYDGLRDLSALAQLSHLQTLSLRNCDEVTDYSPLKALTDLEELTIRAEGLKDIDFLAAMPGLRYLEIDNSRISDLTALADCSELTGLHLTDNYEIEDYTPVGELEQLTSLTIWKSSTDDRLPSFARLTGLKELSLGMVEDLTFLADVPDLERLFLEGCYTDDLQPLTALDKLRDLSIEYSSFYEESHLEALTGLALQRLSLEGTYVYGSDVEGIFGIPTLQSLNLDNFDASMDFARIPDNDSLRQLSMSEVWLHQKGYGGETVPLQEHVDLFAHFPNLEELNLRSNELESIDFVENLPALRYLDITDNRITSLKPLEKLPSFRTVWCGENDIQESVSEQSGIRVEQDEW